jgi:multidrug efflux system outer membrane protein
MRVNGMGGLNCARTPRRAFAAASRLALATLVVLGLLSAGCSSKPPAPYQPPKIELPPTPATLKPLSIDRQWWKAFGDEALDRLVADALVNNLDLARAAANIEEARANLGMAASFLSPRIDGFASTGGTRSQLTLSTAKLSSDVNRTVWTADVGAAVNWEIDLWGRIGQMNDAARARLAASEHTRNATALSVSSAVAQTYFQLRGLDYQLLATQASAKNLKEASDLEYRKWQAQTGTELAYRQSLAELASTEARIPGLQAAIGATELALQVLVGRSPRGMMDAFPRGEHTALPDTPREFDGALLLRRPDVASAEQLLVAANADVNSIRTESLPRLNLSLLASVLATTSKLITGSPLFFDVGAGLSGPIFDAGYVKSKTEAAEARRGAAVAYYRYAVSIAFREVYEAMIQRDAADQQVASSRSEVATRKKSLALTEKSYDAGRSSKFEVLSESIKVLNAQLRLIDAVQAQYIARAQYYKAVGGGF